LIENSRSGVNTQHIETLSPCLALSKKGIKGTEGEGFKLLVRIKLCRFYLAFRAVIIVKSTTH